MKLFAQINTVKIIKISTQKVLIGHLIKKIDKQIYNYYIYYYIYNMSSSIKNE